MRPSLSSDHLRKVAVAEGSGGDGLERDGRSFPKQLRAADADGLEGFQANAMLAGAEADGSGGKAHGVVRTAADLCELRSGGGDGLVIDEKASAVA